MKQIKEQYGLLIIGILIGITYGLATRLIFGEEATLASVTYLFVIPTILGIIPLLFTDKEKLKAYRNIIFIPWLTVGCFFTTLYLFGIEDFICMLILAAPFFLLGTLGALLYILYQIHQEKRNNRLYSVLLLPFLLSPIENLITTPSEVYEIKSEVIVSATPERIWDHIVEVKPIHKSEYPSGFFNSVGIPTPLRATVDKKALGGVRIGYFDGGLQFVETINEYKVHERVSFGIAIDAKTVRKKVFDQHVLNGNYFEFVNAEYALKPLGKGTTKLTLTTHYRLTSKVNFYGKFWSDLILKDFQDRLLHVIEKRCEKLSAQ